MIEESIRLLHSSIDRETRLRLEREVLNWQQSPTALQVSLTSWLPSNDPSLQFFAAQTIYQQSSLIEDADEQINLSRSILHFISSKNHICSAALKKLEQSFTRILVKAFPKNDLFILLFQLIPPSNDQLLQVLAEIPLELDRSQNAATSAVTVALTPAQYAVKHHMNTHAAQVATLLNDQHLQRGLSSAMVECFAAWSSTKAFLPSSYSFAIVLLETASKGEASISSSGASVFLSQISACLISWMEGIHQEANSDKAMYDMIIYFTNLQPLISHLCSIDDYETVASFARLFRLYGELISDQIVASLLSFGNSNSSIAVDQCNAFFQIMLAFFGIEDRLGGEVDCSLFWISILSFLEQQRSEATFHNLLSHQILQTLTPLLIRLPIKMRPSSTEIILSMFSLDSAFMWTQLQNTLLSSSNWTFWVFSSAISDFPPKTPNVLYTTECIIEHILVDKPSTLTLDAIAASAPFLNDQQRLRAAKFVLYSPSISLKDEIIKAYSYLSTPALDSITLSHTHLVQPLGKGFWRILCTAIFRSGGQLADEKLYLMVDHLKSIILSAEGLDLFCILIDSAPSFETILSCNPLAALVETVCTSFNQFRSCTGDGSLQMRTLMASSWELIISKAQSTEHRSAILSLMESILQEALNSLDPLLIPVLDAAVTMNPHIADETCKSLIHKLQLHHLSHQLDSNLLATLPLLNRVFGRKAGAREYFTSDSRRPSSSASMLSNISTSSSFSFSNSDITTPSETVTQFSTFLSQRLCTSSGISDELLRLIVRFLGYSLTDSKEIFTNCINACKQTLTHSQIDIISSTMLRMFLIDPLSYNKVAESLFPGSQCKENLRKLVACRLPRRFAALLLNLVQDSK